MCRSDDSFPWRHSGGGDFHSKSDPHFWKVGFLARQTAATEAHSIDSLRRLRGMLTPPRRLCVLRTFAQRAVPAD